MSAKNSKKNYIPNGYYHIYNRGVEKRIIFIDEQDYSVFLSYLKTYLLPKNTSEIQKQLSEAKDYMERARLIRKLRLNNFYEDIRLLAYCLMPNHFHFLIKQASLDGIDRFMNSLNTRYVMYFNKKYERVGPLYQGVYKAVVVESDAQLLHLSSYIHRNLLKLRSSYSKGEALLTAINSQSSSFPEYLRLRNSKWVSTTEISSFFSKKIKALSYEKFVIGYQQPDPLIINYCIDLNKKGEAF